MAQNLLPWPGGSTSEVFDLIHNGEACVIVADTTPIESYVLQMLNRTIIRSGKSKREIDEDLLESYGAIMRGLGRS